MTSFLILLFSARSITNQKFSFVAQKQVAYKKQYLLTL